MIDKITNFLRVAYLSVKPRKEDLNNELNKNEYKQPLLEKSPISIDFNNILYDSLGIGDEMRDSKVRIIINQVRPHSMVHDTGIEFTIASVIYTIKHNIPGVFVEFGTWRGGCSVAMLLTQRAFFGSVVRSVYMFDSFEGLPNVTEKDGPLARDYQNGVDKESFHDNCMAAQSELESLLKEYDFDSSDYKIIRGWFSKTVFELKDELKEKKIAILRLDGDWYDSTDVALRGCCPNVSEEGVVIVDDYYAWDGCARAVHDYISYKDLPYRIKSLPYNFGAYFIKRKHRLSYDYF